MVGARTIGRCYLPAGRTAAEGVNSSVVVKNGRFRPPTKLPRGAEYTSLPSYSRCSSAYANRRLLQAREHAPPASLPTVMIAIGGADQAISSDGGHPISLFARGM